MPVYPGVSMITLAVEDIARSRAFYERLGWRPSAAMSSGDLACFGLNNIALALRSRHSRAAGAASAASASAAAMTLVQCHGGPRSVEAALQHALSAGATLIAQRHPTPAGGVAARFADPEGHVWELACDPRVELGPDGALGLPP